MSYERYLAMLKEEFRQNGLREGREEGIIQTIMNMLKKNYSIEEISDITGKTPEEINLYIANR